MIPHHLDHAALQPTRLETPRVMVGLPPLRGLLIGGVAVGLGVAVLASSGGGVAVGDLAVLGFLFVGAIVGGRAARRLAPRPSAEPATWLTVVVTCDGPADTQVAGLKPPARPRTDPERRSLSRLTRGRGSRPRDSVLSRAR